uniref:Uncharacterized protein n=1 Tax=Leptocylindrus danicus TaxID=163516 RepID=A0A6U2QQ40_9STRA|mmetsp:Transcript_31026/g.45411  ORF Transcript_31026/g.45411 Transcript_31026/m.45411 type:complete len:833 (+) Transcript_31026:280-2778(+)
MSAMNNKRRSTTSRKSRHSTTARSIHQSAIENPELLSEQRRVRLSLVEGQRMNIEYVGVRKNHLVVVSNQRARESLYRSLPFIRGMDHVCLDEDVYAKACSRVYGVVSKVCADLGGDWMCYSYISKPNSNDVSRDDDDNTDSPSQEVLTSLPLVPCRAVNDKRCKACIVCGVLRVKMHRKYSHIRRLAVAVKERRAVLLEKIRKLDHELYKSRGALENIAQHNQRPDECLSDSSDFEVATEMIRAMNAVIDLDLAQENVMQRVEVHAMEKILKKLLLQKTSQLELLWGELCVIVQALYEEAIPHVQKIVRRFLVRSRLNKIRAAYAHRIQSFSVIEIQRKVRAYLAKKQFMYLKRAQVYRAASLIQCWMRHVLAGFELDRRNRRFMLQLHFKMSTRIQSCVRRILATKLVHRMAQDKFQQKLQAAKEELYERESRAAIVIQCSTRQLIAKNVCAAIRIESKFNPKVRFLANKFLLAGNVWGFLKRVSDDYDMYEGTIAEIMREEDLNAKTFVEKVLKEREVSVANAWNDFGQTIQGYPNKQRNIIDIRSTNHHTFVKDSCNKDNFPRNKFIRTQQLYSTAKPSQPNVGQAEHAKRKQIEKYIVGSKVAVTYNSLIQMNKHRGPFGKEKHGSRSDGSYMPSETYTPLAHQSIKGENAKNPFIVEPEKESQIVEHASGPGDQSLVKREQHRLFRDNLNPTSASVASVTDNLPQSEEAYGNDAVRSRFRMALSNATCQIVSSISAAPGSRCAGKAYVVPELGNPLLTSQKDGIDAVEEESFSRSNTRQSVRSSENEKENSGKPSSSWIVQYSRELTEQMADKEYQAYRKTPRIYF